jgi:pimeloyl-ACP methyl ester carboxylesterase
MHLQESFANNGFTEPLLLLINHPTGRFEPTDLLCWYNPSMLTYSRNRLTFRALSVGDQNSETIILLHGFPADAESWLPIAGQLAKNGYRVLRVISV